MCHFTRKQQTSKRIPKEENNIDEAKYGPEVLVGGWGDHGFGGCDIPVRQL